MQEEDELSAESAIHIDRLKAIVEETIREEQLIINNLLHPPAEVLNRGQRVSDKVARFGGSWKFIIIFGVILLVWIVFNTLAPNQQNFDPYPFILMNLVLSCVAALQAPIIMMSQNRQEEKDRIRSENDYLINLKAELEVRSLHQKMDLLLQEEIKTLYNAQARQISMLQELNGKLDKLTR
ncbi:DUF1003 domain-containing protein [Salmonirosea aquatica]|uniref:DUF1003 domain-containing protein n=1 Tax=Salmonirosea aquatica TaxID=2654236 RepID=A0A7C9FMY9_9BACT|nr:DUF1003 domain-containing protein [Cytophagaceae bacterium SJW1-29]